LGLWLKEDEPKLADLAILRFEESAQLGFAVRAAKKQAGSAATDPNQAKRLLRIVKLLDWPSVARWLEAKALVDFPPAAPSLT
jgi:hypothetical protein